jgi:hypothetical protein
MSLRLVKAAADSENGDDLHLARLLLLLGSADARKKTAINKARAVEGITKLAKMDFLLRYPTCLERAMAVLDKSPEDVAVQDRERTSIETKMIRFRYGPWDARYRRWLGLLSSRGLLRLAMEGNTVVIGLTDVGRALAGSLKSTPLFAELARRSDITVDAVGSMSATRLKNFVYEAIPEITDMKWGEEITL